MRDQVFWRVKRSELEKISDNYYAGTILVTEVSPERDAAVEGLVDALNKWLYPKAGPYDDSSKLESPFDDMKKALARLEAVK